MPPLSKLETCPREILEEIAISLVSFSFLGPPSDLPALLRVSKSIWTILARQANVHLYARIFYLKFDVRAAVRRLGEDCEHTAELSEELVQRCVGLKRLMKSVDTPTQNNSFLKEDLWMAYLMFLESDGNNARQLIHYARMDTFAFNFIAPGGKLHDGTEDNGGWTVDNEVNALAAWLFWFTDKERVQSETPTERQNILQAFAHFFVGSFKYSSSHAPITSFLIPPTTAPAPPPITSAFPLAASPISTPCTIPVHFGSEVSLACPLLIPAALLSCVARLEVASAEMTLSFPPDIPATRAEALAAGRAGPTREDYDEQRQVTTKFVEWDEGSGVGSDRHEHDWKRLLVCYNPWDRPPIRDRVYTPGMLDGVWEGRWFGIAMNEFASILFPDLAQQPDVTPRPSVVYPVPMQFRMREHHQHDSNDIIDFDDLSCDGTGKGVFNAWFPEGTTMAEMEEKLEVYVPNMIAPYVYRTYKPSMATQTALDEELLHGREHEGLYGEGVWDIILTAETDDVFGDAWGYKRYNGRIRDWDGLVVLVRQAVDGEGQWIFRGYVHGNQNLVGRWRETGTPVDRPGWEGVWSMTKKLG